MKHFVMTQIILHLCLFVYYFVNLYYYYEKTPTTIPAVVGAWVTGIGHGFKFWQTNLDLYQNLIEQASYFSGIIVALGCIVALLSTCENAIRHYRRRRG